MHIVKLSNACRRRHFFRKLKSSIQCFQSNEDKIARVHPAVIGKWVGRTHVKWLLFFNLFPQRELGTGRPNMYIVRNILSYILMNILYEAKRRRMHIKKHNMHIKKHNKILTTQYGDIVRNIVRIYEGIQVCCQFLDRIEEMVKYPSFGHSAGLQGQSWC